MSFESDSPTDYPPQGSHPQYDTLPQPMPSPLGLTIVFPNDEALLDSSASSSSVDHLNTLGLQLQTSPEYHNSPHTDNLSLHVPSPVYARLVDIPLLSVPTAEISEGDGTDAVPIPETQMPESESWDMDHSSLFSGSSQSSEDEQQDDVQDTLVSSALAPSLSHALPSTSSTLSLSPSTLQLPSPLPSPGPYTHPSLFHPQGSPFSMESDGIYLNTPAHTSRSSFNTPATMLGEFSPATPLSLDIHFPHGWEGSPMVFDPTKIPEGLGLEYDLNDVDDDPMHSSGNWKSSSQEATKHGLETHAQSWHEEVNDSMVTMPIPTAPGLTEDAFHNEYPPHHHFRADSKPLDADDDALDPRDARLVATETARSLYTNDPTWRLPYHCPGFTPSTTHGNIPCAYRFTSGTMLKRHYTGVNQQDGEKDRATGHALPNPSLSVACEPKYACTWFYSPDGAGGGGGGGGRRVFRCTHRADTFHHWETHIMLHIRAEIEGLSITRKSRLGAAAGGWKAEKRVRCERCGNGVLPKNLKTHRGTVKCREFVEDLKE